MCEYIYEKIKKISGVALNSPTKGKKFAGTSLASAFIGTQFSQLAPQIRDKLTQNSQHADRMCLNWLLFIFVVVVVVVVGRCSATTLMHKLFTN